MAVAGVLDSSRVSPYRVNGSQVWKVSQPWLLAISANHRDWNIGCDWIELPHQSFSTCHGSYCAKQWSNELTLSALVSSHVVKGTHTHRHNIHTHTLNRFCGSSSASCLTTEVIGVLKKSFNAANEQASRFVCKVWKWLGRLISVIL